jgi:hypothetical protein
LSITSSNRPRLIGRLIVRLRQFALDVQQSRRDLSESTQERALPPIPPGDRQRRTTRP